MLETYYNDLVKKEKNGKWGIDENRLVRFNLEGERIYFYVIKKDLFSNSLIGGLCNKIINPLRLLLVDNGQIMPLTFIDRYKFFYKVEDAFYKEKYRLEQEDIRKAYQEYGNHKPKKPKRYDNRKQTINNELDRLLNQAKASTISANNMATGLNSFAVGESNRVKENTEIDKLNNKIKRLIQINEDRVRRGY